MKYFLDTNIIIYAVKGTYPKLIEHFENVPSFNIFIPSIVKAELEYGAKKSKDYKKAINIYNKFLDIYNIIPFTEEETIIYGDIRSKLEKSGSVIGGNDMLIASIVKSHDGVLVTHNKKEFERIEGLRIEDWTE